MGYKCICHYDTERYQIIHLNTERFMANEKRVTLASVGEIEYEEKKSIFIGYAAPVRSEEEAKAIVEEKKREYADATHNVWAYYIDNGARARYSDDGEPQGTAGPPILNVLKMSGATDMCVVVTRYFGGTLLGAGGLVRAYSAAAKQAIDAAGIAVSESFAVYSLTCSYSEYQRLTVQLKAMDVTEDNTEFGEGVTVTAAIEEDRGEELVSYVRELTNGRGCATLLRTEERPSKRIN